MPLLTPEATGYLVTGLLILWLTLGVHIGVALGLAGFIGIYLAVGPDAAFAQLTAIPFGTTNSFALAVIPLFILMGSFATVSGITTELFRTAYVWLGALRGGLAMATVMSSAAFGAASGSTIVNAAVFTRMAMPEMTRFGYDVRLSTGSIAAAGTLAALIPPSILMVIYAVITEQSIGKLLIAGIIPGILTALIYCGGIHVIARVRPDLAPRANLVFSWGERFQALRGISGIVVLFTIVVGGILFARFLTYSGLVTIISSGLLELGSGKYTYLFGFVLLFLVLGCFIEPIAIMVMTLPIMFPVMKEAGFDPILLGVIAVKLAEIGVLTPPVGLNVFVVKSASPVPVTLGQVFTGVTPFILLDFLSLGIYIAFPEVVLWLPRLMGPS